MHKNEQKPTISVLGMTMGSGGAEKVISLFLPKLMDDYKVTLVLFYDVFHFEVPEGLNVEILIQSKAISTFQKIFLFPVVFFRYLRFIKKGNVKVSISFLTRPNFINGLLKIFLGNKIKVIMSERNYPSIEYRSSKPRFYLYKLLIPLLYNKADCLFSNSEWINKDLKENFNVSAALKVIYNPIILPQANKKKLFSVGQVRFINVGRVIATKNQELIIDAFDGVRESYFVSFLGDGNLMGFLRDKIEKSGNKGNMQFVGKVKNVNDYLAESDCFILSSNSEGFPNVIVEAMAQGLPIIATNCLSGPLEILNNNEPVNIGKGNFIIAKYGILINVGDKDGLKKAIEYVIGHPGFIAEYSDKSLQRAKTYSIGVIYNELNNLIKSCLN